MKDTRSLILDFVRHHPHSTAHEIAQALHLTSADVRYHLNHLVQEGSLRRLTSQRQPRRGRPAAVYASAHLPSPDALSWLCELLIGALTSLQPFPSDTLRDLVNSLIISPPTPTTSPSARRLNEMVRYLQQVGYEAHWEAHFPGPKITLSHCPYWPLPKRLPQLCLFDKYLLERLSGLTLEQVQRANLDEGHPETCLFKINTPAHEEPG
ncbi:helix-turn-helix transcriptional regulator [Thermanaerothrix daxensis]